MTRTDVTFPSGDATCAAWLYTPTNPATGKQPIVVMAHGLGAVKEMRLDAFAERFTAAGYVCLVLDYRHFGASSGEPRQLVDIDRQLEDWRSAVAYAATPKNAAWPSETRPVRPTRSSSDSAKIARIIVVSTRST